MSHQVSEEEPRLLEGIYFQYEETELGTLEVYNSSYFCNTRSRCIKKNPTVGTSVKIQTWVYRAKSRISPNPEEDAKSIDTNQVVPWGKIWLWFSKIFYLPKMLEINHMTDVSKWVLLSDPPFVQKSRIQGPKMVNWRTAVQTVAANWRICKLQGLASPNLAAKPAAAT